VSLIRIGFRIILILIYGKENKASRVYINMLFKVEDYIYIYRVYQNDWRGFEVDYIHKYGEQNYKY